MYDFSIERAKNCIAGNKINEAIEILEILKNDSEFGYKFDVLFELSKAYVKSGNNQRAAENLEKCLEYTYDKNASILLSGVFECEKRLQTISKNFIQSFEKGEKCKDIHVRIIRILLKIKRYVLSKNIYRQNIRIIYIIIRIRTFNEIKFTFDGLSKRELLELEFLYNDLLNGKSDLIF
jgi:tetratricopeptide (TPR) repeat protein